ncbi:MAG: hypothetical protein AB1649_11195, partial [Chloroflexota bacterium]
MSNVKVLKKLLGRWFAYPWYPILFGAYPVLALLSANAGQVQLAAGGRALIVSVLLAGMIYLLSWLALRQAHRAAFLTTLILILFFAYGHVYNLLTEKYPDMNLTPWLASGCGILLVLILWWTTRPKVNFASLTAGINVIVLGLAIMSGWQASFGSEPRSAQA